MVEKKIDSTRARRPARVPRKAAKAPLDEAGESTRKARRRRVKPPIAPASARSATADHPSADREARIRSSFARQGLMRTIGAAVVSVSPGSVEIALRPAPAISQQHGFVHAGAVSAIADSAAGYAALSLIPKGRGVLTTEFKINFLAPAVGERVVARAKVVKAGRLLTLAQTEVFAKSGGEAKLVALLTATMMNVEGRDGVSD